MSLTAHLESYGIRRLDPESYREWRAHLLGPLREAELDRLRRPLLEGRATVAERRLYWDYAARPPVAGAFYSLHADAIRAAGEFVATHLPRAGAILDIGCATGYLTTYYAARSPAAFVTGCDLSSAAIEVAADGARQRELANVRFRVGNWMCDLVGEQFDCLVATQALGYEGKDPAALAQLACSLPVGGQLIVVESFDSPQAAEAFVRECAGMRLALEASASVSWCDLGEPGHCPRLLFQKCG